MKTGDPAGPPFPYAAALREGVLCLWFVLVGAAFWGTYAGLPFAAPLTPLYGLFLAVSIVLLALRLLRGDKNAATADRNLPAGRKWRGAKRPGGVDNQP